MKQTWRHLMRFVATGTDIAIATMTEEDVRAPAEHRQWIPEEVIQSAIRGLHAYQEMES